MTVENFKHTLCTFLVQKEEFAEILQEAVATLDNKKLTESGFEISGMYPINPNKVNYSLLKFRNKSQNDNQSAENAEKLNSVEGKSDCDLTLTLVNENLHPVLSKEFEKAYNTGPWTGNIETKGLYEFWVSLPIVNRKPT